MSDVLNQTSELMGQGDFEKARAVLTPAFASSRDVPQGLMLLFVQCYINDFAGAKATLDTVRGLAPHLGPLLDKVGGCASSEWTRLARLTDVNQAGKRQSFRPPPPFGLLYAKAEHAHASKDFATAKATLDEITRSRPKVSGTLSKVSGEKIRFRDFVDTDDLTGGIFPIYYQGTIFDLPFAELKTLEFLPKSDPFYGLWPSVKFETTFGAHGVAPFPMMYPNTTTIPDPMLRLGRVTKFDHDRGYAVAQGLRDFWVEGEDGSRSMMGVVHFERIDFNNR
jgi:protein involved in temperature-dependent protein secretion